MNSDNTLRGLREWIECHIISWKGMEVVETKKLLSKLDALIKEVEGIDFNPLIWKFINANDEEIYDEEIKVFQGTAAYYDEEIKVFQGTIAYPEFYDNLIKEWLKKEILGIAKEGGEEG